jgi:serine/threonine protein kinase
MSPEMLRYGKASASADVYSFGIMLWELLTGQVAFRGWQWGAILEHVALSDGRPPIPEGAPEDFVLLLESCWHKDPARRPAFTEVGPRAARGGGFLCWCLVIFCSDDCLATALLQSAEGRAGCFALAACVTCGICTTGSL